MKKIIFAAVAALFIGINANAQSVNENEATVADVVAQLNQADTSRRFTPTCSARSWFQSRTR